MSKQVQDAYIVAATRTPVGKVRGALKNVRPDDMLAHVIRNVMARAPGLDPQLIGDVVVGCAMPEAEQGMNVARIGLLLAGLPNTVPGMTINRFCSSGVQAVALDMPQRALASGATVTIETLPSGWSYCPNAPLVRALTADDFRLGVGRADFHLSNTCAPSGVLPPLVRGPMPRVMANDRQMTQLFQNLIGNAIKFRGPAPPRVEVTSERKDDEWRVSVADNGIGIAPEYFDRLFVVFQRLHTRTEYEGNGIGLAICKKIVERHGGRIGVEAAPGAGATFHFTLRGA